MQIKCRHLSKLLSIRRNKSHVNGIENRQVGRYKMPSVSSQDVKVTVRLMQLSQHQEALAKAALMVAHFSGRSGNITNRWAVAAVKKTLLTSKATVGTPRKLRKTSHLRASEHRSLSITLLDRKIVYPESQGSSVNVDFVTYRTDLR